MSIISGFHSPILIINKIINLINYFIHIIKYNFIKKIYLIQNKPICYMKNLYIYEYFRYYFNIFALSLYKFTCYL